MIAHLAILLVVAAPAPAQSPPRALSLDDARRIAAENNPAYRKAANELTTATAAARQGWAAFLPRMSLDLSTSGYLSRTYTGQDNFGQPIRRDDPLEYTGSSSSQGVSLSNITLFDGGRTFREVGAVRAEGEAAEAGLDAEAAALEAELARRYYDARRRGELIRLEEELLRSARARRDATERLLRIASASPLDLLGADIEVARQEQALATARGEARKAMLALAEQMGVAVAEWELTTEAPAVFDPAQLDAGSLVARALEASPRLAQAEARYRASEQRRRAAGAARWPTISGQARFGRSLGVPGYDALFDPNPLNQSLSFGFNISLPLFTQFQTTQQIARARATEMNAAEDVRALRLALDREVRGALIDLENAHRGVRVAEQARDLARRRVELADQQYRVGAIKFVDLQNIFRDAAQAERDALAARYDFAAALATLEERAGIALDR